ncbi:hypothetical protein A5893_13120 [Pedobacter psychrophilus]|uniref:Uncharacterized protein n=1 Tax=Pedobacter psychrophilus TaxID=1826909 RepID=A0A179DET3_9SPHI|nr:hypothetical protein A5893_13120 [Pedobacter psychrophilus]
MIIEWNEAALNALDSYKVRSTPYTIDSFVEKLLRWYNLRSKACPNFLEKNFPQIMSLRVTACPDFSGKQSVIGLYDKLMTRFF